MSSCIFFLVLTDLIPSLRFATDTAAEHALIRELSLKAGAHAAVVANHWALGGAGAADLGLAVIDACKEARNAGSPFRWVYI